MVCEKTKLIVVKNKCKECYMKEWNNNPRIKRRKRLYEKRNKIKRKLRQAQRLIFLRTKSFVPITILKEILKRDNWTCQYCGSKRDLSFDHKIPISNGGNNDINNIVIACCTCNAMKSNLSVKEFKKGLI